MRTSKVAKVIEDGFHRFKTPRDISEETGIPLSTIANRMTKLRRETKYWLAELAREGYLGEYKRTLDVYDQIIKETMEKKTELEESRRRLHQEMNDSLTDKNDIVVLPQKVAIERDYYDNWFSCQKIIHAAVKSKLEILNDGPMVWAMEQFIRQNTPKEITGGAMKVLTGEENEEGLAKSN